MNLRRLSIERYKGYAQPVEVEFAPLTILVGSNNSGKTALAQTIQLLAGALAPAGKDHSEPLPLESGGIQHGETFADLVTGRLLHGQLRLSVTLTDDVGDVSMAATIRNVVAPDRPPERQIADWRLAGNGHDISLQRQGLDAHSEYEISVAGIEPRRQSIDWRGLIPLSDILDEGAQDRIAALQRSALGIRHLQCPRRLLPSPFAAPDNLPASLGPDGWNTPLALAANDELRESVRKWYENAFGEVIDVVSQGTYSGLMVGAQTHNITVALTQSGRGLSHVLPAVVMALTARTAGPGVDVIEHPEAELHPAAHADLAELLLDNLPGPARPLVVETHSEMVLLRARRWVAERRIPADHVLIYWVHIEPQIGSTVRKIRIDDNGELNGWPDGVFIEDYEEITAIRRAARANR